MLALNTIWINSNLVLSSGEMSVALPETNYLDTYAYTNTVIQVLKAGVSQNAGTCSGYEH